MINYSILQKFFETCPWIMKIVGYKNRKERFTENDWTNLNWKYLHPYHKSKTLAEQAAWDFMKKNPDVSFSLTVLNPTLIIGPLLQNTKGSSVTIISRFLDGSMAAYPLMKLGLVDVRDVARAHILAMKDAKSNGQRILINAEVLSFRKIANVLREEFAKQGYSVPRFRAPYALLWLYARIDNEALQALPLYGHEDNFDNTKALKLLDMSYRDVKKSLIEMAYDMIERNILPRKKHAKKKKQ
ncbi:NADPH-dependent aldehyde reductase [Dirofilaria immitis]